MITTNLFSNLFIWNTHKESQETVNWTLNNNVFTSCESWHTIVVFEDGVNVIKLNIHYVFHGPSHLCVCVCVCVWLKSSRSWLSGVSCSQYLSRWLVSHSNHQGQARQGKVLNLARGNVINVAQGEGNKRYAPWPFTSWWRGTRLWRTETGGLKKEGEDIGRGENEGGIEEKGERTKRQKRKLREKGEEEGTDVKKEGV